MLNVQLIQYSLEIAVFSFVYSALLTEQGQVLAGWKAFLYRITHLKTTELKKQYGNHWQENYNQTLNKNVFGIRIPVFDLDFLYKPLIDCERCVAGQIALWSFFFIGEGIFSHLVFITTTIFLTALIKALWQRIGY